MNQRSNIVTAEEIFKGFFSKRKWVNLWYKPRRLKTARLYILEFSYPYENNLYGDQVIWCLYSRKDCKIMEKFITTLGSFMQSIDRKLIVIDDYEILNSNLLLRIALLSDGYIIGRYGLMTFNDPLEHKAIEASIGIMVGQEREIIFDQDVKLIIAMILGHALSAVGVHDDFTDFGARLLNHAIRNYHKKKTKQLGDEHG